MGFKSRSTPGGGGYCEMAIHDRKGRELVNIHSQKDMLTTVQHTQATVVNGPQQTNTVTNGFHVTQVKKRLELESQTEFIRLKAATEIVLEAGASRIRMEANGKITIQGLHVEVIGTQRIDLNTNGESQQGHAAPLNSLHTAAFVPSASASGMTGLMQGLRGETSVMEKPSAAQTLGKQLRTGGQIVEEMYRDTARDAWDAIESGNPVDIALAATGFLPMGAVGKVPRAVGKVLAEAGNNLVAKKADNLFVLDAAEVRAMVRETGMPFGKSGQAFNVGSESELNTLFVKITAHAKDMAARYHGTMKVLPDGTRIGLRNMSATGGQTIDVFPIVGKPYKVHIEPK